MKAISKITTVILLGMLAAWISFYEPAASAQSATAAQNVRDLNGQTVRLLGEFQRAKSQSEQDGTRGRALDVLTRRFAALQDLARRNPTAVLQLGFPVEVLNDLNEAFSDAAQKLEARGKWQGRMEVLVEDDTNMRGNTSYRLVNAQGRSELYFARTEPNVKTGDSVEVSGVKIGDVLAVSETTAALETASAPVACGPTGPQKIVMIMVNFQTLTLPSAMTAEHIKGVLYGNAYSASQSTPDWSVRDFWEQNSDGKTTIDVAGSTVVGPYNLTSDYNLDTNGDGLFDCQSSQMLADAIAAADPAVNFSLYNRVMVVFPKNTKTNSDGTTGGCTWAGLALVGCGTVSSAEGATPGSYGWLRADQMATRSAGVKLLTHEGGHNLGMSHSRTRDFGAEALGALNTQGTLSEYGDVFSTMGAWNFGFYGANHAAERIGWLTSGVNYTTIEQSGTYTIQNYEARPAGMKALKVRRGTGNSAWLWIESRTNTGIYHSTLGAQVFNAALIHYQDSFTSNRTDLLDFTTATSAFTDPALALDQTWVDPYSNLSITVVSASSSGITVQVNYGAVPCVQANPTVTVSPTALSVPQGNTGTFNVTVVNNDTGGCTPRMFNLTTVVPGGWTYAFGATSLTLNPGQSMQTTLSVTVPSAQTAGTFPVSATATSGSSAATSNANVTVTQANYTLGISLSGKGNVTADPPGTVCSAGCTLTYAQAANETVMLTAKGLNGMVFQGWTGACTGTATTCTVTMNASKTVTAKFGKKR